MPLPTLSATGPYLAYLVNLSNGQQAITLLDSDGIGRKVLPFPVGAYVGDVTDAVSPDGEWVAFHTGTVENEPYDLALNLMHLPDGEIFTVAYLLSPEYPNIFESPAEYILRTYPDSYGYYTISELIQKIQEIFRSGIYSLGWSPNSRYLAFAGQMNGTSSDIYRYDVQLRTILQLTDGPEQIFGIMWSPNGEWILHEASNFPMRAAWAPGLFAVKFDGSHAKELFRYILLWGWISPTTYAIYESANGPGEYDLRFVDIETDETLFHWPDCFDSFAIDTESNAMVIDGFPFQDSELRSGLYLIFPSGTRNFLTAGFWPREIAFWGGEIYRFIVSDGNGTFGITQDGSITKLSDNFGYVDISPDHQWVAIHSDDMLGIALYTETDGFVHQVTNITPDQIIWRPDSNAIFFRLNTALYYAAIPDGQPTLVDNNVITREWLFSNDDYGFVWIK